MRWNRRARRRLLLVILLALLAAFLLFVRLSAAPVVQEMARALVESSASTVINEAIEQQLQVEGIDYDSIVTLETNANGAVTALKTNINEINRLKTSILSLVDSKLMNLPVSEVGLPLGSLILPEFFAV